MSILPTTAAGKRRRLSPSERIAGMETAAALKDCRKLRRLLIYYKTIILKNIVVLQADRLAKM